MADRYQLFQEPYPAGSEIMWQAFSFMPIPGIENELPRAAGMGNG